MSVLLLLGSRLFTYSLPNQDNAAPVYFLKDSAVAETHIGDLLKTFDWEPFEGRVRMEKVGHYPMRGRTSEFGAIRKAIEKKGWGIELTSPAYSTLVPERPKPVNK